MYELPAANTDHARIIMNLILVVFGGLVRQLGGELFTAPVDVFLPDADPVQPDQRSLISKRGVEGAPALVVEVLSASNPEHDQITKRALSARAGVEEFWIVSPEAAIVEMLILDAGKYRTHARVAGDEPLSSTILPELDMPASVVFA